MQTKLTLRLEEKLIRKAKAHARQTGRSVSQLVADYFSILGTAQDRRHELTPNVKRLKGVLRGKQVGLEDYKQYLEEKYR
jgi:hypothetical protein